MYEVILIDLDYELHGTVDHIYDDYNEATYVAAQLNHKKELDTKAMWGEVREYDN